MKKKVLILIALVLAFANSGAIMTSQLVGATTQTIKYCHATTSATNPYNLNETDADSIMQQGHGDHTGDWPYPVVSSLGEAQHYKDIHVDWGDIIPPFTYTKKIGRFDFTLPFFGLNYDAEGQAMIQNNCEYILTTPTAASFIDATCDNGASYTIPSKTGVEYFVNGSLTKATAATYPVTSNTTISVVARAATGYTLNPSATATWSKPFVIPTAGECIKPIIATPAAVTFVKIECDTAGSYTIPTTAGVRYFLGDETNPITAGIHNVTSAGTIAIHAEAADGYELTGTQSWSNTFTEAENCYVPIRVTPAAVVFTDIYCDAAGTYTIPTTTGVKYYLNDEDDAIVAGVYNVNTNQTVKIYVEANEGFVLSGTDNWSKTFIVPTSCSLGVTDVVPNAVKFVGTTCSALGSYTIPATMGIDYLIKEKKVASGTYSAINGETIIVNAVPSADNYSIKTGSETTWTESFTAPTNCDNDDGDVLGVTTVKSLPNTSGTGMNPIAYMAAFSIAFMALAGAAMQRFYMGRL